MGSFLSRPVPLQEDDHPAPLQEVQQKSPPPAQLEASGGDGNPVVKRTGSRKRKLMTDDQSGDEPAPAANGTTVTDSDTVTSEHKMRAKKRLRQEFADRATPKRKGQWGQRRRKSTVRDLSDMFREIDLSLECNLCHKHFQSHAQQICHNPCFYVRKGMTAQPVQWTCPQCHKFFNSIGILRQHMTIHFEGSFCCKQCGLRATRRNLIVDHITKKHLQ